jgi:hypothetical protein
MMPRRRKPYKPPRPAAEILDDAIEVLTPCDAQEARAHIARRVEGLRQLGRGRKAPARTKKRLRKQLKRMQEVRDDLVEMGSPEAMKTLLSLYDEKICVVQTEIRNVRPGSPQPNIVACCAVAYAHDLLQNSARGVQWARWYDLAGLLYEGATGECDADLSYYLRLHQEGRFVQFRPGLFMIADTGGQVTKDERGMVWVTGGRRLK